jgi:hypothetical protein
MPDEVIERRLTREERKARDANRRDEAKKAIAEHKAEQKRLRDNRER